MSARGEKRGFPDVPNIPLCMSLVVDKDIKIRNRIYSFNLHKTWSDILVEIASELEKSDVYCWDLKTTGMENITVQISAKLNGSEVFYLDIEEEVDVVHQFDASLKCYFQDFK
jgi:hypothetical protein